MQKLLDKLESEFPEIVLIEEKRNFTHTLWIIDFDNGNSMVLMKQPPPYIGDCELYTIAAYNKEENYDESLIFQGDEAYLTSSCVFKNVDFIRSL